MVDRWAVCVAVSERLVDAADRIEGERIDRHERYRTWSMNPASAEELLKTLLALGIHALVMDAAARGDHDVERLVRQLRLTEIEDVVTKRPSHELLAGLPPGLSEGHRVRVAALRVLMYDDASALSLARLCQMIRISLLNVAAQMPASEPTCADVESSSFG
ncbi:hypothetical protein [Streptomyces sp. NPDC005244]|uniref:hypothetical protein n=1 Tax=Streptomyces sp. NPDC005244 TaxID=3364708 RepID=UPI0036AF8837